MKYKIKKTNIEKLKIFLKKIENNKIKKEKNGNSI
tara:strand:- start:661 stop:765 length:105 start_codon:yes stop_codon:yes gene_type:complete